MSGLLALLDDVAGIAKVAAASVDDVVAAAGKAGAKTAGVIIDDAAVTPKYVQGFAPARELPIIWRIARGSFFNKLILLFASRAVVGEFRAVADHSAADAWWVLLMFRRGREDLSRPVPSWQPRHRRRHEACVTLAILKNKRSKVRSRPTLSFRLRS